MLKLKKCIPALAILLVSCGTKENKVKKLDTENDKVSYAIGVTLAQNMKPQGINEVLNYEAMEQGIKDKFSNKVDLFPEDSIQDLLSTFMPKHIEKIAKKNLASGKKFLEENKKKNEIKTTASGLQYKIESKGSGKQPGDDDVVSVNYILSLIDGTIIEDSKKTNKNLPVDISLSRVVPGWKEGVKLMSKGSKYTLYVPSELAYGENGPMGPNQVLIFETELVDFKTPSKEEKNTRSIGK